MKIAVLGSGGLGLKCIEELHKDYTIDFIATDGSSAGIIEYAIKNNIPYFKGNPRKGKLFEFAKSYTLDILFSINYLYLIEEDIISIAAYPINFHGSLLPKYRGRTPHVWAIINNEKITGITAHLINKGCDTGDIILQKTIEIGNDDTGNDVLQKYVATYPTMLQEIIHQFKSKIIKPVSQLHEIATYFNKRTPEDGEINWDWQKERIYNWVRAQAYPYPGAFTFYGQIKVVIDKIEFSELGYTSEVPNGTIRKEEDDAIYVKTPNGMIQLISIRNKEDIIYKIKTGEIFKNL